MTLPSASPAQPTTAWAHADERDCERTGAMLEVVGQRWSAGILLALARGAERFSEIVAAVPGLSARMLTVRLQQLGAAQLVEREVIPTIPVSVRYHLTERGNDLMSAIEPISGFVRRWDDPED
ncbi:MULTISPECIES: winged helix-turn-helix transcriptional regulator [Microbacterium]|nr:MULTISPECIES: helix-turn-helix domain-containing protein [Microbacterium]